MTSQPADPVAEQELPCRSKATTTCNVSIASCIDPIAVPNCNCGEPAGILTSQTSKNPNRQFFACAKEQRDMRRCTFFHWCDEMQAKPAVKPATTGKMSEEEVEASELQRSGSGLIKAAFCQSGVGDGRGSDNDVASKRNPQCFECGQYGHLARECTFQLETLAEELKEEGGDGDLDACFKCQKPGHWAKDCPLNAVMGPSSTPGGAAGGDVCFKCNQTGHWARECPMAASHSDRGWSTLGHSQPLPPAKELYPCLRCGETGHWAKDCTKAWREEPIDVMGAPTNVRVAGMGQGGGGLAQPADEQQQQRPPHVIHDHEELCFKCSQPGHWASECPNNATVSAKVDVNKRNVYPCLRCGKTGHWAKDCTQAWREEPLDVMGMNTEAVVIESAPRGTSDAHGDAHGDVPDDAQDDARGNPEGVVGTQRPSVGLDVRENAPTKSAEPSEVEDVPKEAVDVVPISQENAASSGHLISPPPAPSAEPNSPSETPVDPPAPIPSIETGACAKRQSKDATEMPPPKNHCVRQHADPAIDVRKLPLSMRGGGGWDVRKD